MENRKREIIEAFLKREKLLTPKALDFLARTKNYRGFLQVESEKLVLDISDFLAFEPKELGDKVKILLNLTEIPNELRVEDFASFYRSRYEKVKKLILQRLPYSYVSIDKLTHEEAFIIGMVREIRSQNDKTLLEVEDLTAKCSVLIDKEHAKEVEKDDVLAIKCRKFGDLVYASALLYPDIPLRSPKKGRGKIVAISDLHLDEAPLEELEAFLKWFRLSEVKFLFIAGDIGDVKKLEDLFQELEGKSVFLIPGEIDDKRYPAPPLEVKNEVFIPLSNPAMIELNGIKILLIHEFKLQMLKKRLLGRPNVICNEEKLVLEEVPDLVIYGHTHEASVLNFKSITLVNPGSLLTQFKPVLIDLATRDYSFVKY